MTVPTNKSGLLSNLSKAFDQDFRSGFIIKNIFLNQRRMLWVLKKHFYVMVLCVSETNAELQIYGAPVPKKDDF